MSATVSCGPLAVLTRWLGRVALLLGCACGASAPAGREAAPTYVPAAIQLAMGESIISQGTLDTSNRYKATVWVDGGRGDGAMELVGIAKTHYGGGDLVQFSEYTSTLFYRAWLLQVIADVERGGTD